MLRARRRVADRLVADGGLVLRLPFHGPLDWERMVAYFGARAIPCVEHVSGATYRRTIVIGGDPGVLELSPGGDDHLILRVHLPHWEELIHIVERARRIASLDLDLDEPACQLADDPIIGRTGFQELAERWRPWRALAATHFWLAEGSARPAT